MSKILISVIIPTHNRLASLLKLLSSLEKQSLHHSLFQVIVVPSPLDLCIGSINISNYSINIEVLEPLSSDDAAKNVSAKRNLGAKRAKGQWLAFTDDDCVADFSWLAEALILIKKYPEDFVGIEGITKTPDKSEKTLTYKGLQRLKKPLGLQTCNIFYNKIAFNEVGGLDEVNFPWFLEDTALAWSMLEAGKKIIFSDKIIIYHPVGAAAPWRNLHEAKNTGRKLILLKKFPHSYKKFKMALFRPSQYLYLVLNVLLFFGLFLSPVGWAPKIALIYFLILALHMLKLFFGLRTTFSEVIKTAYYTAIWPLFAAASIIYYYLKIFHG